MQHNANAIVSRIASKELHLFFTSPIAYLFLAAFAVVSLFTFFWAEAFFARNIADIRPLFEWMPILLIFLAATLTMRLWSEEKRTGTIESVLTQPVSILTFVLGKFFACLVLLAIALAITLPLPVTVSLFAKLDWGPVISGYIATFLLGAVYLAIGLFVSARSENQIVSLLTTVAVAGAFYLIGSPTLTSLVSNDIASIFSAIGTGSRFNAITRGMLDVRDLYYYLSLIGIFIALNVYVLEKQRWSLHQNKAQHGRYQFVLALLIANLLLGTVTLHKVTALRFDTTQGKQYSISPITKDYLAQLKEPLLIRGYFSSKTHPLLAPLVPQLKDLLNEYKIAAGNKLNLEIIDPSEHPELEKEANEKYNIKPVPFQVNDRYQAAIVSSYFNVLVQYGDQYQVLGFDDLIEVKAKQQTVDVLLRNPEHDITAAIKKVMQKYQSAGNLFDTITEKLTLTAYISDDSKLPQQLLPFKTKVFELIDKQVKQSKGKLSFKQIKPEQGDGHVVQQILKDYGFQPMSTNIFSTDRFYFYLILQSAEQTVQIPLDELNEQSFSKNLSAAIQRFAHGFNKTVALVAPKFNAQMAQYGLGGAMYNQLKDYLGTDLNIINEDLSDGKVSGSADILMLVAPKNLSEKQLFAVDQFLMQGGTVIAATSPYSASFAGQRLSMQSHTSGLADWLKHYGITIDQKLVLDPQSGALPIPVTRDLGGIQVRELRMLDYPYFADIREQGFGEEAVITSGLPQVLMAWSSPISLDKKAHPDYQYTPLLHSSEGAWLSSDIDVMPKINAQGQSMFSAEGKTGKQLLAVVAQGSFESYFAQKGSPFAPKAKNAKQTETKAAADKKQDKQADKEPAKVTQTVSVIKHAPKSARIVVFASNDFVRDEVVQMISQANSSQFTANYQLLANTLDWALDDSGLAQIRARGHFNRTLPPMKHSEQLFWEYLNYGLAIVMLVLVAMVQRVRRKARVNYYQRMMQV